MLPTVRAIFLGNTEERENNCQGKVAFFFCFLFERS
jgi:hypothetical protein